MVPSSMSLRRFQRIATVVLLTAAPISQSQTQGSASPSGDSGRTERANPLDPRARVPALVYQSPLAGYRRLGEDRRVDWKEANETVNRIGGWRAYAREAQQPDAAVSSSGTGRSPAVASSPASPASAPAPAASPPPGVASASGGHGGSHHGGHHGGDKPR